MSSSAPVELGIAGIGGYARHVSDLVFREGNNVAPQVRFAAVCDPDLQTHAKRAETLRSHGVAVYESFEQLLTHPGLDATWLPVPIALHRPFAEQALAAGKAVMVEKPAAGSIQDVDAMIDAQKRAGLPVFVGFQDVYDSTSLPLKRRILAGEFGPIQSATLHACWPRPSTYFSRATWPGRLKMGDTWVLDSPANNALAHFIHIALFFLGPTLYENAQPTAIDAELYRAAPIENYDTICATATFPGGVTFRILLTHACTATKQPVVTFKTATHTITRTPSTITVHGPRGDEPFPRDNRMHAHMLQRFARAVRGIDDPETAAATLEMARGHTLLINGASEATPIISLPERLIDVVNAPDGGAIRSIPGIEAAFDHCVERGQTLHESRLYDWTRPPGRLDLRNYTRFTGPKQSNDEPLVTTRTH